MMITIQISTTMQYLDVDHDELLAQLGDLLRCCELGLESCNHINELRRHVAASVAVESNE